MKSYRVVALAGSLRRASRNRALLLAAAECAPPGMTIKVYDDLGSIPLFSEDLEQEPAGSPAGVRRMREAIFLADGLLLATPEYNHSMSGVMKNAVDWLSRPGPEDVLTGRPVAVIGATSGRWGTRLAQAALRQTLYATEALVLPSPWLFAQDSEGLFDDAGRLADASTRENLQAVLTAFAEWIERARWEANHDD